MKAKKINTLAKTSLLTWQSMDSIKIYFALMSCTIWTKLELKKHLISLIRWLFRKLTIYTIKEKLTSILWLWVKKEKKKRNSLIFCKFFLASNRKMLSKSKKKRSSASALSTKSTIPLSEKSFSTLNALLNQVSRRSLSPNRYSINAKTLILFINTNLTAEACLELRL